MNSKALIVCPYCRKVRKFGEWIELTYTEQIQINSLVIEEIKRVCDDCQLGTSPATPLNRGRLQR